uniref:U4/U6.U5 small nuclear ribonucleoprotein 27 kDa protein n=1 Tax=Branchiostoma floridae TaxID=7739 RepID=C3YJ00_BRAFL|eukprot:XP_002603651.1 hypothetical protein BRAFLDRAFT_128676 [Branchiostoma floridae]
MRASSLYANEQDVWCGASRFEGGWAKRVEEERLNKTGGALAPGRGIAGGRDQRPGRGRDDGVQRGADVPDLDHDPQSDDADQGPGLHGGDQGQGHPTDGEVQASKLEGKTEDEIEMMKMMGFCDFDSTKGKQKKDTQTKAGAANILQKRRYRTVADGTGDTEAISQFITNQTKLHERGTQVARPARRRCSVAGVRAVEMSEEFSAVRLCRANSLRDITAKRTSAYPSPGRKSSGNHADPCITGRRPAIGIHHSALILFSEYTGCKHPLQQGPYRRLLARWS